MTEEASPVATVYQRHGDAVTKYVRRRVPDADVDDVVSEVFLVLAGGKPAPAGAETLPWLYAVAYRVVCKHHSRSARRLRLVGRLAATRSPDAADPTQDVSSTAWVNDLFARLPPTDAELLRLIVFEDLTVAAAGASLGISAGAAHTPVHRIRKKVQPWIERDTPQYT